jgi:hypothetical protein
MPIATADPNALHKIRTRWANKRGNTPRQIPADIHAGRRALVRGALFWGLFSVVISHGGSNDKHAHSTQHTMPHHNDTQTTRTANGRTRTRKTAQGLQPTKRQRPNYKTQLTAQLAAHLAHSPRRLQHTAHHLGAKPAVPPGVGSFGAGS